MKSLQLGIAAAALLAIGAPATAQLIPDSEQFVQAVEKQDAGKATQLLSSHPTIVDARNGKGDTALIVAITRGDPEWTGFLLNKGADANLPGAHGNTPLIAAARVGFEEAAGWLLGMGAKVDATNRMGETPLIIAVQQHQPRLVKALLDAGANPDKADAAAGYSARDYAARDARARDILKLIEAKKPKTSAAR